jgi:hypothetical protein
VEWVNTFERVFIRKILYTKYEVALIGGLLSYSGMRHHHIYYSVLTTAY